MWMYRKLSLLKLCNNIKFWCFRFNTLVIRRWLCTSLMRRSQKTMCKSFVSGVLNIVLLFWYIWLLKKWPDNKVQNHKNHPWGTMHSMTTSFTSVSYSLKDTAPEFIYFASTVINYYYSLYLSWYCQSNASCTRIIGH